MGIIYCHKNKINGKCYIGQTSKDLAFRVGDKPQSAYSNNKDFVLDIENFGWQNFESLILENVDNDMLNERETFWINKMKQEGVQLYNKYLKGTSNFHKTILVNNRVTEEDKDVIRRLFDEGKSLREISELISLSPQTIKKILINFGYDIPTVGNLSSFDKYQKEEVFKFVENLRCPICGKNFSREHEIGHMLCGVSCRHKYLKLPTGARNKIKDIHDCNLNKYRSLRERLKKEKLDYSIKRAEKRTIVKEKRKKIVRQKTEEHYELNKPKHTADELQWRKDDVRCKQKLDLILNSGVDLMKFGYNTKLCKMFPELTKGIILFLLRKYNIPHFERKGSKELS